MAIKVTDNTSKATKVKKSTKPTKSSGPRKSSSDVQGAVMRALGEMHVVGIAEVPLVIVCMLAGYSNPRTATFAKKFKELESEGLIVKAKKGHFSLSEKGISSLPEVKPSTSNQDVHKRLLSILEKKIKTTDKLHKMWDELCDGGNHDIGSLAAKVGYNNKRSANFAGMIASIQELGLAEKSKSSVKLTDLAFPFGRP